MPKTIGKSSLKAGTPMPSVPQKLDSSKEEDQSDGNTLLKGLLNGGGSISSLVIRLFVPFLIWKVGDVERRGEIPS